MAGLETYEPLLSYEEKEKKRKRKIIIVSVSALLVFFLNFFLFTQVIELKPLCGNGKCDIIENYKSCPTDCTTPVGEQAICGDGKCEFPEDKTTCPVDCRIQATVCGDGKCEVPETRTSCPEDCELNSWLVDYKKAMVTAGIPNNYLASSVDYDYGTRNIQELIYEIRSNSGSAEEAVKRTAREVYSRVAYVYMTDEVYKPLGAGTDCSLTPASKILARGWGLCTTQSKVNIAILRGMGIAARPMSGCVGILGICKPLSILPGDPLPKFSKDMVIEGDRAIAGGGAHGWLEAWLPDEGWVLVESTNGVVYKDPGCARYNVQSFNPTTMAKFCWIWGKDYIDACEDDSLFD